MNCVKFISRYRIFSLNEKFVNNGKVLHYLKYRFCYSTSALNEEHNLSEYEEVLSKIIYNEVLKKKKLVLKKCTTDEPICLKYLRQNNEETETSTQNNETEEEELVSFPYKTLKKVLHLEEENRSGEDSFSESIHSFTPTDKEKIEIPQWDLGEYNINLNKLEKLKNWAFEDESMKEVEAIKFGSCNPHKKVSSVPCGGCGALLHCNDATLPGFIPAEVFESKRNAEELQKELCQRCHFLREFDIALGVNVSPSEYLKLISEIKKKEALVIIMVDMLDFPCSIFPGIFDLIGSTNPVIIIGNKVDLLIKEGDSFLDRFKEALIWNLRKQKINLKNVKHVGLISAKSGYGIENLIDLLFKNWGSKGDVYLVGCTNVGKSTLFNTLISSDYCKVKAYNLMHRATVSAWPGTTLNLLKFPIMKTQEWRLISRSKRLNNVFKEVEAFKKFQELGQNIRLEQIPLKENVGRTFAEDSIEELQSDDFSVDIKTRKGININDPDFAKNNWFHDTPGVIHEDQIINFLTTSELILTLPKKMLLPRNFYLQPGHSLFIGGLARLDYINGADFVWFTVFASMELPITVTRLEDADYVYQKLLGSPLFRVPVKGKKRLEKWPGLSSKKFELYGNFDKVHLKSSVKRNTLPKGADVDIVLSSAGWISVNVPPSYRCNVEAWTPEGRGIYLRHFPIISKAYAFRGERIQGTPAFKTVMKEVEQFFFN